MFRRWKIVLPLVMLALAAIFSARNLTAWSSPLRGASAKTGSPSALERLNLLAAANAMAPNGARTSTDILIRQAQAGVRMDPHSTTAYTNLALAYMQKERETADVTYYSLTDDALKAALRLDPTNAEAIDYDAWVALGRHDFQAAAELARRAITLTRYDSASYANLGDAEANLGDYPAMLNAYQRMVDLKPSLASYNRASYARWLYGDLRGATRLMLLAIRAGSTQPENVAWCESQLGDDYYNAGFVLPAEQMYRAALHAFPHYARALSGLGMVEYSLGHRAAAIRYERQAVAVVPLPQYLATLGDLYAVRGNTSEARKQYATIAFIDHMFVMNHVQYGIETAMFDADHNQNLAEALRTASGTAKVRHDIQTDDTLAWVLYKTGRYAAAWKAERQALRLGTHYAPSWFHAGMIQAKLGNLVEAQSYLQAALMENPNFSVLYAPVARAELNKINHLANTEPTHPGHTPPGRP